MALSSGGMSWASEQPPAWHRHRHRHRGGPACDGLEGKSSSLEGEQRERLVKEEGLPNLGKLLLSGSQPPRALAPGDLGAARL